MKSLMFSGMYQREDHRCIVWGAEAGRGPGGRGPGGRGPGGRGGGGGDGPLARPSLPSINLDPLRHNLKCQAGTVKEPNMPKLTKCTVLRKC